MLMPAMVFGLETVIMSPKKMEKLMQNLYFKVLPILGVNRHITKEWRMLSESYHGLGLPNFVVLCFAAKLFFLQCQLGFDAASGEMLTQA